MVSGSPVTVETTGRVSGPNVNSPSRSAIASAAGWTSGEWNACDTLSRVAVSPPARASAHTASTSAAGPAITVCAGPL